MTSKQIVFLLLLRLSLSLAVIDVVFTVKNLATNDRLKSNFITMIHSLFEHTARENLYLHVIGDSDSHALVRQTLHELNYHEKVTPRLLLHLRTQPANAVSPLSD